MGAVRRQMPISRDIFTYLVKLKGTPHAGSRTEHQCRGTLRFQRPPSSQSKPPVNKHNFKFHNGTLWEGVPISIYLGVYNQQGLPAEQNIAFLSMPPERYPLHRRLTRPLWTEMPVSRASFPFSSGSQQKPFLKVPPQSSYREDPFPDFSCVCLQTS